MTIPDLSSALGWAIIPLIAVGSLLHFVYEWSGRHRVAAVFSAVNESYWEHIKIALWPVAVLDLVLFALGGYAHPAFLPAVTVALYSIPVSMVAIAFAYKAFTKRNILWVDIALFGVSIALAQVIAIAVLQQLQPDAVLVVIAGGFLVALVVGVVVFTLRPPREPDLFVDPLTGRYGTDHGSEPGERQ